MRLMCSWRTRRARSEIASGKRQAVASRNSKLTKADISYKIYRPITGGHEHGEVVVECIN